MTDSYGISEEEVQRRVREAEQAAQDRLQEIVENAWEWADVNDLCDEFRFFMEKNNLKRKRRDDA